MKDAMRVDYYGLLKTMGNHSQTLTNQPQEFQKQASDNNRLQQQLDTVAEEDDAMPIPDDDEELENTLPVGPAAAPEQRQYQESGDGRLKCNRKCMGAPFGCKELATKCSAKGWENCNNIINRTPGMRIPASQQEAERIIAIHKTEMGRHC